MIIESANFANIFKAEIVKAIQKMLDNNENIQTLDSLFSSFIVSYDDSYSKNIFHVFSGEELGFEDIERVFLFLKES